jgi:hypothetical protein
MAPAERFIFRYPLKQAEPTASCTLVGITDQLRLAASLCRGKITQSECSFLVEINSRSHHICPTFMAPFKPRDACETLEPLP